jgi:hypothetical protein
LTYDDDEVAGVEEGVEHSLRVLVRVLGDPHEAGHDEHEAHKGQRKREQPLHLRHDNNEDDDHIG